MPSRLQVPMPDGNEELRAWAEVIADLEYVVGIILENPKSFLPGELVGELVAAWTETRQAFERIVSQLSQAPAAGASRVTAEDLARSNLDRATGKLKRSILDRLRDEFFSYFYSDPVTEEKLRMASEAAEGQLDVGAVVLDSLGACASQVPGWGAACKVAEEGVLGVKHLLRKRRSRGY